MPVGSYLSGGIDSSVITALVKKYTDTPLRTFSVSFADAGFDETAYQQQMVEHLDADHSSITCTDADIGAVFPDVIWHTEKPVVRTAPAPLFLLSRLVRQSGYKVVLTGEGADEILAGYDLFKEVKVRALPGTQSRLGLEAADPEAALPLPGHLAGALPRVRRGLLRGRGFRLSRRAICSHAPRWKTTSMIKVFYSGTLPGLPERLPQRPTNWPSTSGRALPDGTRCPRPSTSR